MEYIMLLIKLSITLTQLSITSHQLSLSDRSNCLSITVSLIHIFSLSIFLFCLSGQTALHIAAEQNRRDICVMLVAAGANLLARDDGGNTAMMVAFNKNANEIAAYLESKQVAAQAAEKWANTMINDDNIPSTSASAAAAAAAAKAAANANANDSADAIASTSSSAPFM